MTEGSTRCTVRNPASFVRAMPAVDRANGSRIVSCGALTGYDSSPFELVLLLEYANCSQEQAPLVTRNTPDPQLQVRGC